MFFNVESEHTTSISNWPGCKLEYILNESQLLNGDYERDAMCPLRGNLAHEHWRSPLGLPAAVLLLGKPLGLDEAAPLWH